MTIYFLNSANMLRSIRQFTPLIHATSAQKIIRLINNSTSLLFKPRTPKLDFDQVCVRPEIEQQLIPVVKYLINPNRFDQLDIAPKGVLLSGPPGTGKSALAEAIAGQAGVPFILISCASLTDKYIGETERKIREVFEVADQHAPCVICFDEFDTLASERKEDGNHRNDVVNQLLTLLSEKRPGVIVIGTTNSHHLDPAVVRPGRFDRTIYIDLPNPKEREKILAIHTRNKKLSSDVVLKDLAKMATDFSGAQLACWVKEASLLSVLQDMPKVTNEHFFNTYILAVEGTAPQYHENERIRYAVSVHEMGHAFIAHTLGKTPIYISITKSNGTNGKVKIPQYDLYFAQDILDAICMCLGGIAAEEVYNIRSAGLESDLNKARELAKLYCDTQVEENLPSVSIHTILNMQKQRGIEIIHKNKKLMNLLITDLQKNHYLSQREFLTILEGKTLNKLEKKNNPLIMPKKVPYISKNVLKKNPLNENIKDIKEIERILKALHAKTAHPKALPNFSLFLPAPANNHILPASLTKSRVGYVLGIDENDISTIERISSGGLIIELTSKSKYTSKVADYIEKELITRLEREEIRVDFRKYRAIPERDQIFIRAEDVDNFIEYIENRSPGFGMS